MKQFILRHRKNIWFQALSSASIISLCVYAILRCLFHEFPMAWLEEVSFFMKTFMASCLIISTATGGSAWLYRIFTQMKAPK
jgi:hypothetical protein